MVGLSLNWALGLGMPALVVQTVAVSLARALRTYSRSRLEELCEAKGRPEREVSISRNDEWTERSAEALALCSSLLMAALVGAHVVSSPSDSATELTGLAILIVAVIDHVAAAAVGRVFAEPLLYHLWPLAAPIRLIAAPLTAVAVAAEWIAQKLGGPSDAPRPASVEVEIPADVDHPEDVDNDLPESTREMLERVVELTRRDVSEIMTPRASMLALPASISSLDAARAFRDSGYSRLPVFGESRDDIIGVLYAKDLFPAILDAGEANHLNLRKLVRLPYFVPETKNANDLLEEFRVERIQIAVVLDEYGAVVGLVTFEDLIEELVGPVDDEHDKPTLGDPVVSLGDSRYDVDATVGLEELNERLNLHLPTDGEVQTVGGYAFHVLGRLPEPGASFRVNGVLITVLEVEDHSIRRVRVEIVPAGLGA